MYNLLPLYGTHVLEIFTHFMASWYASIGQLIDMPVKYFT